MAHVYRFPVKKPSAGVLGASAHTQKYTPPDVGQTEQISARERAMSCMKNEQTIQPQNNPSGPPKKSPVWNADDMPVRMPMAVKAMPTMASIDIDRWNSGA